MYRYMVFKNNGEFKRTYQQRSGIDHPWRNRGIQHYAHGDRGPSYTLVVVGPRYRSDWGRFQRTHWLRPKPEQLKNYGESSYYAG